jgi:hypothetical protein
MTRLSALLRRVGSGLLCSYEQAQYWLVKRSIVISCFHSSSCVNGHGYRALVLPTSRTEMPLVPGQIDPLPCHETAGTACIRPVRLSSYQNRGSESRVVLIRTTIARRWMAYFQ